MMYKIRITTTVEQVDFDGRVLFSVTDSIDESSVCDNKLDVPEAFHRGMITLRCRMKAVLNERYDSRRNPSRDRSAAEISE